MIQTEYMKMVGFIMKIQNMNNYKCERPNNGFNFDQWAFTSTKAQYKCRNLAFVAFCFSGIH
jgi:hypothetical protein